MQGNKTAIITDSTCDIPEELIEKYGITVLPHIIIWGEEEYRDRVDLQPEDFYRRIEEDQRFPTSSQASVQDFLKVYEQSKEAGAEDIIVLTVSSAMSGTFQSATNAAAQTDIPVHVIDSKGPTMSLGWQVLAAARALEKGASVKAIIDIVNQVRNKLNLFVCMDTLDFLRRGGRIGNATRFIGTKLNIKPLVSINHLSGVVEPEAFARTHKKIMDLFYKKFFEQLDVTKPMRIAILHGNVLEEAQMLAERIQKEFSPVEILINITGPVLGINTGPRALALCGYNE